jgi:hypothetical protein
MSVTFTGNMSSSDQIQLHPHWLYQLSAEVNVYMNPTYEFATRPAVTRKTQSWCWLAQENIQGKEKVQNKEERGKKKSANQERTKHGKRETSVMTKLHEGLSGQGKAMAIQKWFKISKDIKVTC